MVMCVTSNWALPQQLCMIYIHHERISRTTFVRKGTLGITTGACVLFSNTQPYTHNCAITTTTEKQQQKVSSYTETMRTGYQFPVATAGLPYDHIIIY
jgi:hypothetical protein